MMCGIQPHTTVIRVYDEAGNVIETHEQGRVSKTDRRLNLLLWRIDCDFRLAREPSLLLCFGRITSATNRPEHCQQKQHNFDPHSRFTTQSYALFKRREGTEEPRKLGL